LEYKPTPSEALQRLVEGNWRFRSTRGAIRAQSGVSIDITQEQRPFAAILTCADSRLFMESLFDCGRGDLFVCRVAGNILDDALIGSLEFAVYKLKVPLILVLGHEACGAVTAACDHAVDVGHISRLVEAIQPAVELARMQPGELVDNTIRANVALGVESLRQTGPLLQHACADGSLLIEGAYYHLSSGEVELMHV
jgi:carbonic anhydrase